MNKTLKILNHFLIEKKRTMLGVGPMSKNCVDTVIDIVNQYKVPIFLIASRRQIECKKLGGGYCNNWNTENFARYVFKKNKNKLVLLSRDHGGPFQGNTKIEVKNDYSKTLEQAKQSYKVDIDNNFKIIHIDTSFGLNKIIPKKKALEMLFELYFFVCSYSKKKKKEILIEIGTEEQSGGVNSFQELENFLNTVFDFTLKNKLQRPTFVVIQSGTKVMETRNVGIFESPVRIKGQIPVEIQLFKVLEICKKYNIFMKEHNADYINNDSIKLHPLLGIHASNVAPEFGVTETLALLDVLEKEKLFKFKEEFIDIAFNSNKWEKWVINKKKLSKIEKAIICGHYVFTEQRVKDIKEELNFILKNKNINLDMYLRQTIKKSILRYMRGFGH